MATAVMFRLGARSAMCGLLACVALVLGVAGCGSGGGSTSSTGGSAGGTSTHTGPTQLRVSGNHLVIGSSATVVQLRGVNRSGTEYRCEQGGGIFDSPTPDQPDSPAMLAAMRSWDIDVVRVPLNEGCWLGQGASTNDEGLTYQKAIEAYVQELNNEGFFVILSLQWLDINGTADYEPPMPDATYAPSFWQSVASTFKRDPNVLYDLYNEPFDVNWTCWKEGCSIPAGSGAGGGGSTSWPAYESTGMQELVDAVRETGAKQPLILGGINYALDLSGWLANEPSDPDHALIASVHSYGGQSPCHKSCQSAMVKTAASVPVIFGELGENDCGTSYIEPAMQFADAHGIGYLGWAWDAVDTGWSCTGGPALIDDYDGEPTTYGAGFEQHFQELGPAIGPSGTGTGSVAAGTTSTASAPPATSTTSPTTTSTAAPTTTTASTASTDSSAATTSSTPSTTTGTGPLTITGVN